MCRYFHRSPQRDIEILTKMDDITRMSSSLKPIGTAKIARAAQSGQFIGRAKDGTAIVKPNFKPERFTVRQLQKVIRDVQTREELANAG